MAFVVWCELGFRPRQVRGRSRTGHVGYKPTIWEKFVYEHINRISSVYLPVLSCFFVFYRSSSAFTSLVFHLDPVWTIGAPSVQVKKGLHRADLKKGLILTGLTCHIKDVYPFGHIFLAN